MRGYSVCEGFLLSSVRCAVLRQGFGRRGHRTPEAALTIRFKNQISDFRNQQSGWYFHFNYRPTNLNHNCMKHYIATLTLLLLTVASSVSQNMDALQWRFIGPVAGNRGSVVLRHPTEANTFYHGASNGLWKTEDAGIYQRLYSPKWPS